MFWASAKGNVSWGKHFHSREAEYQRERFGTASFPRPSSLQNRIIVNKRVFTCPTKTTWFQVCAECISVHNLLDFSLVLNCVTVAYNLLINKTNHARSSSRTLKWSIYWLRASDHYADNVSDGYTRRTLWKGGPLFEEAQQLSYLSVIPIAVTLIGKFTYVQGVAF